MPPVAPPPSSGEAAPRQWTAERASPAPDPAPAAAHPLPVAAARTAATGGLSAVLAQACAGVAVLAVVALRLIFAGGERLSVEGPALVLVLLGFGLGSAAALTFITRAARPSTLVFAMAASIAWPVSGHVLPAALVALLLLAALVVRDLRVAGSARAGRPVGLALAVAATAVTIAGAATATVAVPTGEPAPEAPRKAAASGGAPGHARAASGDAPGAAARADDAARSPARGAPGKRPARRAPAERFVRAYYADLDAQRFAEAWAKLSPGVHASLGPYARWKAGYGTTLSSTPRAFDVDGTTVTHTLLARDRGCGRTRRFRVTWELVPAGRGWIVDALAAVAVGPQEC